MQQENKKKTQKDVMLNSFQHPLHFLHANKVEILNQVQDDNIIRMARGFTLIELLVVVLIIGILAAVALPQYKLAVEKSRATEIITQLKALAVAEQVYFLANGEYTNIPENLDLSFQDSVLGNKSITQDKVGLGFSRLTNDPPYIYGVLTDDSHADNNHQFFLNYVLTTGEIYCEVHNTATDLMKKVCKSFGSEAPCPKNNGTAATCYKAY